LRPSHLAHGLAAFSIVNAVSKVEHFRSELTLIAGNLEAEGVPPPIPSSLNPDWSQRQLPIGKFGCSTGRMEKVGEHATFSGFGTDCKCRVQAIWYGTPLSLLLEIISLVFSHLLFGSNRAEAKHEGKCRKA